MGIHLLGISGSPRADGNTDTCVKEALTRLKDRAGIEIEFIRIADFNIKHCEGCRMCMTIGRCEIEDDDFDKVMDKIRQADRLIVGAPVYWNSPPGIMKDFIDRTHGFYASGGSQLLKDKKAGIISVATDSGFESHEAAMESWLRYYGAEVIGKVRVYARERGDILKRPAELEKVRKLAEILGKHI